MIDISTKISKLSNSIYRMEKGDYNFSIDNPIKYLSILGYGLYIKGPTASLFYFDIRENFGKYLKALREQRNLSQKKLASTAGITNSVIIGIENGNKNTSIDSLLSILQVLNCEIIIKKIK